LYRLTHCRSPGPPSACAAVNLAGSRAWVAALAAHTPVTASALKAVTAVTPADTRVTNLPMADLLPFRTGTPGTAGT
jgi:hypothetical protein